MDLIRIAEARRDQHLGTRGMPVLKTGRARFRVAANLLGQFPGDWGNAVHHEIVTRGQRRLRWWIGRKSVKRRKAEQKPTGRCVS